MILIERKEMIFMEFSITDLIGMLNLGVIIARGRSADKVEIPQEAAIEINVYLKELKAIKEMNGESGV
jgi:hypothetical protein